MQAVVVVAAAVVAGLGSTFCGICKSTNDINCLSVSVG